MRALLLALLVATSAAHAAERLPTIAKGTGYAEARRSLLSKGWRPATMPDAQTCDGDPRCKGRPEMEACAGTGLANCLFIWRKDKALIEVSTIGEDPQVAQISCRSGCAK